MREKKTASIYFVTGKAEADVMVVDVKTYDPKEIALPDDAFLIIYASVYEIPFNVDGEELNFSSDKKTKKAILLKGKVYTLADLQTGEFPENLIQNSELLVQQFPTMRFIGVRGSMFPFIIDTPIETLNGK